MTIQELLLWFMLGVVIHIIERWMAWRANEAGRRFMDYWKEYTPLVINGMIANLGVLVLYHFGVLDPMIRQFAALVGYSEIDYEQVRGILVAAGFDPAAFDLQKIAATVTVPFQTRQAMIAVPIGYLADSIAKGFMPAFKRAGQAAMRKTTEKIAADEPLAEEEKEP